MTEADQPDLATFVGGRIRSLADSLVERWIEWVRSRVENPLVETLPERALRNHIPPVLDSLGRYVADPSFAVRSEMIGHLRLHAQMRRDQGYRVKDLLDEFDGLAHLVDSMMQREVARVVSPDRIAEALTVFARLNAGLRSISFVTVSVFDRNEAARREEMAEKLSDFAEAISHELRSPLQSAKLIAAVMLQDSQRAAEKDSNLRQRAEVIQSAMNRIEGLLDDVDLLARTEGARTQTPMAPLPGLFEGIRDEVQSRARQKGVRLELAGELPRVAVERAVAQLALANVVGNAIKYSDPDKSERWVRVAAEVVDLDDTPWVQVEVTDNGVGIAPDYQSRIFQRGFRAHPELAEGTGLGLAITQELILARGGTIALDSETGAGTTVRFRLRATEISAASPTDEHPGAFLHDNYFLLVSDPEDMDDSATGPDVDPSKAQSPDDP